MPNMNDSDLLEVFYAVGDAYDEILRMSGAARMSIIAGYVSPTNPYFDPNNDWRTGQATFTVVPPEGMTCDDVRISLCFGFESKIISFGTRDDQLDITVKL